MGPVDLLYLVILCLIKVYKWIEFQVLKLFRGIVNRKSVQLGEKYGVIFHFIEEGPKDKLMVPEWEGEVEGSQSVKYDSLVHVKVHSKNLLVRVANMGIMGLAEGYMDGDWDCGTSEEDITELAYRVADAKVLHLYFNPWNWFLNWLEVSAFNLQTPARSWEVARKHYDIGNDLYEAMLDPWMQYTCAYWAKADNLNQAQIDKMDLIARKLDLKPGMRVLDIGCGWGTLCKYLAENYGVSCVGVTISEEGVAYGKKICKGLDIDIRLQDYRDVNEEFDRIVSVGMFEHVGVRNYKEYFTVVRKCLKDDGVFLLHTIGCSDKKFPRCEPFYHTYIFPNGCLPYNKDITRYTEGLFVIEDWHNFGQDYAKTLRAWRSNFIRNWPKIQDKYGERFYRMWIFYLSMSAGGFKARQVQLWQVVLSKNGLQGEYRAAR